VPQQNTIYERDRLVGLAFATVTGWCRFRAPCGYSFNCSMKPDAPYALVDIETGDFAGIQDPAESRHEPVPTLYRVYLLRPLAG
jgi:hypothetical protein